MDKPTPRTDARVEENRKRGIPCSEAVPASFARELERELERANRAIVEAFEYGVCVKARYTTRGDKWRVKHADAIDYAKRTT